MLMQAGNQRGKICPYKAGLRIIKRDVRIQSKQRISKIYCLVIFFYGCSLRGVLAKKRVLRVKTLIKEQITL